MKENEGFLSFSTFDVIPGLNNTIRVLIFGNQTRSMLLFNVFQETYEPANGNYNLNIDIQTLLYKKTLYFSKNSKIVNIEYLEHNSEFLNLLVVGSDTAIYDLNLTLAFNANLTFSFDNLIKVENFYQNYVSYVPLSTMNRMGDYFQQGYWSRDEEKLVFVLYYHEEKDYGPVRSHPKIQQFIGGDD